MGTEVQGRRKRGALRREEGDGNGYRGEGREEHYVGRRAMGKEVQGRGKRGALRREEGDGNGSTGEKEERSIT